MHLFLKETAATLDTNRESHDEVAGDIESIDAEDLAEAVNDRI